MSMPDNLIIVRHGESWGNLAKRRSEAGDDSIFKRLKGTHTSHWPLTEKGFNQAIATGKYLNKLYHEQGLMFDHMYVSSYARAIQTASAMELIRASWYMDTRITERDWGDWDNYTTGEREQQFSRVVKMRKVEPFFWEPPGGESFNVLCLRIRDFIDSVHRSNSTNTIVVCHGEVAKAFRIVLCRLTPSEYAQLEFSTDPLVRIHNCQIEHYSKRHPHTAERSKTLEWLRISRPAEGQDTAVDWRYIPKRKYTNAELFQMANKLTSQFSDINL